MGGFFYHRDGTDGDVPTQVRGYEPDTLTPTTKLLLATMSERAEWAGIDARPRTTTISLWTGKNPVLSLVPHDCGPYLTGSWVLL